TRMKDRYGILHRHRRAFSIASLGMAALALVACGSEDDEEEPTAEATAPVEETVATGEPTEADEATQVATAAVEAAATPDDAAMGGDEGAPASPPVTHAAAPVGGVADVEDEASPVADAATPVGGVADVEDEATPVAGADEASPVAADTEDLSTTEQSPVDAIETPAEYFLGESALSVAVPISCLAAHHDNIRHCDTG